MKKKFAIGLLLIGLCFAMACQEEPYDVPTQSGTPEPFPTLDVQPTVVISATDTPAPTSTSTPTPTPTDTATPTPTPTYSVEDLQTKTERRDANTPFVMLDPGHGGGDPGACVGKIYESDINLSICLKVADKLMERGIQVIMTRSTDKKNPAYKSKTNYGNLSSEAFAKKTASQKYNYFRRYFSDHTDVDLFVSVHQNDSSSSKYKGCEVWRTKAYNKKSASLADNVFACIKEQIGYARWVVGDASEDNAAKNLIVLQTNKPSILVECGYMSNEEELAALQTDAFQEKLADGIVQGIIKFFKEQGMYPDFDFGDGDNSVQENENATEGNQP